MLLAGDINCILETNDSTGYKHFSRALARIVNELDQHDVWDVTSTNKGYTHYASKTASKPYRIYVTKHLRIRKTGVEIISTAFTDNFAVELRLAIDAPQPLRGRVCWKMNVSHLHDATFMNVVQTQWARWQQHKRFYPNTVMWCGRYAKGMMGQIFIQ
jgi:hypothetical protein